MTNTTRLIAVVVGSGSGKTWLAAELGDEAGHLCLDSFYRDPGHLTPDERCRANFDDPAAIDWEALRGLATERGRTPRADRRMPGEQQRADLAAS